MEFKPKVFKITIQNLKNTKTPMPKIDIAMDKKQDI